MRLHRSPTSHAVVVLALSLLVVVTGALAACARSSSTATTPPAAVGSPPTASAAAGSPSPSQSATASSIGDGVYLVGTDIPAGIYKGTTLSDVGLWQISSDVNGSSIIANDTTTAQFYVQVQQGQYLELRDVEIVKAAAAPTKMRSSVGDGVYLVGTDIPAGRYRGTMGEFGDLGGSWKISRDANGTLGVSGADRARPFYIHVKKGRYLELWGLKVRRVK